MDEQPIVALVDRCVDLVRQQVLCADGERVSLTTRESQLFGYLARRPEQDVSRDELLEDVWEYRATYQTRAVDVTMRRLRAKVEPDPKHPVHLISVHGIGYRFVPPADAPTVAFSVAPPPPERARTNLREEPSTFFGREHDLETLREHLQGPERLVTVTGPGGVGKTRFAVRCAAGELERHPGGVWFVDLTEARDVAGVLVAVGRTLEISLTRGDDQDAAVEAVGQALDSRGQVLLILDNVEQVLSATCEVLDAWLRQAPSLRVLATSRERLRLEGEVVFDLAPLPPDDARALFLDRVESVGGSGAQDPASVERIVEQLDGLPLAIELAAPRARVLTLKQLSERLARRFRVLAGGGRDAGRQATLRGVIDASWELLSPAEQSGLAQCAAFRGGFTLEAAEEVLRLDDDDIWVLDVVEALRDKSLLRAREVAELSGEIRFQMLESVRAYALEKLDATGKRSEVMGRHARWTLATCGKWARGVDRKGGFARFQRLAQEVDNLLAVERRNRVANPEAALHAALALEPVLSTRGPASLARRMLDLAVDHGERGLEEGWDDALELLVRVLIARAKHNREQGQMEQARADLASVLQRLGEPGTVAELSALMELALLANDQSRIDESETIVRQALALCSMGEQTVERRSREGVLKGMLAHCTLRRGETGRAEQLLHEALRIHEDVGNERGLAGSTANLALVAAERGQLEEADRLVQRTLEIFRKWGATRRVATTLFNLAPLRQAQGRTEGALEVAEEALGLLREVGYRRFEAIAGLNVAMLRWSLGRRDEAEPALRRTIEVQEELGDDLGVASSYAYLTAVLASSGDLEGAEKAHAIGQERGRGFPSRSLAGTALMAQGFLELARADRGPAADAAQLLEAVRDKAELGSSSDLISIQFLGRELVRALDDRA